MAHDPHALKLYIDGNSYKNPGGAGGFACVAEYAEALNREDEIVFQEGFHQTTTTVWSCLPGTRAFEFVKYRASELGVQRVLIITDSRYVDEAHRRAAWTN